MRCWRWHRSEVIWQKAAVAKVKSCANEVTGIGIDYQPQTSELISSDWATETSPKAAILHRRPEMGAAKDLLMRLQEVCIIKFGTGREPICACYSISLKTERRSQLPLPRGFNRAWITHACRAGSSRLQGPGHDLFVSLSECMRQ